MTESKSSKISFIGMIFGAIALLIGVGHYWAGSLAPEPTVEDIVAEKVVSIKNIAIDVLKGEDVKAKSIPKKMNIDKVLHILVAVLAGLAMALAIFGFAKHEPLRSTGGAILLGGGALALQYTFLAIGAIFLVLLSFIILSKVKV